MKNLSPASVAALENQFGTEPVTIVEINWRRTGFYASYATKAIQGLPGHLTDVGQVDNSINVSNSTYSQAVTLSIADPEGTIKSIIDRNDVHQVPVRIYQWFEGMAYADRFLIFSGRLTTPFTWSEYKQGIEFTAISDLENKEFGFSPEEGEFDFVPKDLIGKAWPSIFGIAVDVPACRVGDGISGTTLCGVGILAGEQAWQSAIDRRNPLQPTCGLSYKLWLLRYIRNFTGPEGSAQINAQIAELLSGISGKDACHKERDEQRLAEAKNQLEECTTISILGGEDFPQNRTIELDINGGLFVGTMNGTEFTIQSRTHPEAEAKAQARFESEVEEHCDITSPAPPQITGAQIKLGLRGSVTYCYETPKPNLNSVQIAEPFWAEPGSTVTLSGNNEVTYMVSIVPGDVLAVKAYKEVNGIRKLVNVPNDLWEQRTVMYGPLLVEQVVTFKKLSSIFGQEWEDDLFVTFESSIGTNTIDIIEYVVNLYTDLTVDPVSFAAVKAQVANLPSDFPVLEKMNTLDLLRKIARDARCALWVINDVIFIKYLAQEPDSDMTITSDDIEHETMEIAYSDTGDLVTSKTWEWHLSWAEDPERIVTRLNQDKYGTKQDTEEILIANRASLVNKIATFWSIREGNTWKLVRFTGMLRLLQLDTYDTVTINEPEISDGAVKAVVQTAVYDPQTGGVSVELLVPVQAGTMVADKYFWPAGLPANTAYPTIDIQAGSNSIWNTARGALPVGVQARGTFNSGSPTPIAGNRSELHPSGLAGAVGLDSLYDEIVFGQTQAEVVALIRRPGGVFTGGPNIGYGGHGDYGDRRPSDQGYVAEDLVITSSFANITNIARPDPPITLPPRSESEPFVPEFDAPFDLSTTPIIDSVGGGQTVLASAFGKIASGLVLNTSVQMSDGGNDGVFGFKFDTGTSQWGSANNFLQD